MAAQDVSRLARAVLGRLLLRMRFHEREARRGVDPEGVHRMRVQTRRLRGMLRLFRDVLPPEARQLRLRLKSVAAALGAERDEDVLLGWLRRYLDGATPPESRVLRTVIARRVAVKKRAHARLVAQLDGAEYRRLCGDLAALCRDTTRWDASPRRFARRAVHARLRRARRCAREAQSGAPEPLHELRVAVKNLRYAAEVLEPLLPRRSRALGRRARAVQDLLGEIHDLDVLVSVLDRTRPVRPTAEWQAGVSALRARVRRDREARWRLAPGKLRSLLRRRLDPA